MISPKFPAWMWAAALVCAVLSLFSISKRHQVEHANRSVALAVEMENIQALAAAQGVPVSQALKALKQQGLQAVVLSEESVAQLISEGRASEINGRLAVSDPAVAPRVERGLKLRIPGGDPFSQPTWIVRTAAIGLGPEEAQEIRGAGLMIIARCSNVIGATPEYIEGTLNWAHELGAQVFLPQGDQVLGRREELKSTVETLQKLGMLYATPEFAKISGDESVVGMAPDSVVRLHAAQSTELDRMTLADAVERYSKAARERNMRILLVRPMSLAGDQPVADFGTFLGEIRAAVQSEGGMMAPPAPFKDSGIPKWLPVLIALTAVPVVYWIGLAFPAVIVYKPFSSTAVKPWAWIFAGLMLLLAVASVTKTGAKLGAFAASMAFPTAALLSLDARKLRSPLIDFLITSLFSWVGGLAVAGMLNGLPYFVRAETFPGVKASVFLPLLIVALYYFFRLTRAGQQIQSPITWRAAVIGMLLLGALAFMIARTGNDAAAGVSPLELQFRNLLDRILIVRPRTKEFLIGHPALIVGIGLLMMAKAREEQSDRLGIVATLAIMLGAMGQTSMVNTMCHLHTPVFLSLARIAEGLVLGSIIGLALWWIVKRYALRAA